MQNLEVQTVGLTLEKAVSVYFNAELTKVVLNTLEDEFHVKFASEEKEAFDEAALALVKIFGSAVGSCVAREMGVMLEHSRRTRMTT